VLFGKPVRPSPPRSALEPPKRLAQSYINLSDLRNFIPCLYHYHGGVGESLEHAQGDRPTGTMLRTRGSCTSPFPLLFGVLRTCLLCVRTAARYRRSALTEKDISERYGLERGVLICAYRRIHVHLTQIPGGRAYGAGVCILTQVAVGSTQQSRLACWGTASWTRVCLQTQCWPSKNRCGICRKARLDVSFIKYLP
jgi:hypothetical protein